MNYSGGTNWWMVVRGNPVPVVCPSTATPSTKVPQPFQWTRAELAARGAGPGLILRPPQLPPLPLLQRKPLARSTRRLTVTPGPCYRPRESAGLRGDSQGKWTKEEATLPSARYERAALSSSSSYSAVAAIRARPTKTGRAGAGSRTEKVRRKRLPPHSAASWLEAAQHQPRRGKKKKKVLVGSSLHYRGRLGALECLLQGGASPLQALGGSFLQGSPKRHIVSRSCPRTCTDVRLNLR